MITPDNEVFDAVFQLLQEDNLPVYDMSPDDSLSKMTEYGPYIVIGATQLLTGNTKTQLQGAVAITLHVWGNRKQRWEVSKMTSKVFTLLSSLKSSQHYNLQIRPQQTMNVVAPDKYDNASVWHGVLDVTYAAY
ncbi:hypothetical protein [Weissella minor]|uniref:Uncharacterized protein n=1 Tax=Weissella minor TaxID=1620 RepID=A0A0R2JJ34_9LACO|nr:hypothetical protein [Weissella minor]KRN77264.1 hypothetical protein IV67_GL000053 [Weissella minor]